MANLQPPRLTRMRSFFRSEAPTPPTPFYLQTPRNPVDAELVRGLDVASFASGLARMVAGWAKHEYKDAHIVFTGWTALQVIAASVLEQVYQEASSGQLLETLGPISFDLRGEDASDAMSHIQYALSFERDHDGFPTNTGSRSRLWLLHDLYTSQKCVPSGSSASDRAKYAVAMEVPTRPGLPTATVQLTVIGNHGHKLVPSAQDVTCESLRALFRQAVQDLVRGTQLSAEKLVMARYAVQLLELRYRHAASRDQLNIYQSLSRSHEAAVRVQDLSSDVLNEAVKMEQSWWRDTTRFFATPVPPSKEIAALYVKHFELTREWLERRRQLPFDTDAPAHSLAKHSPFEVRARSSFFWHFAPLYLSARTPSRTPYRIFCIARERLAGSG
ncbi:hypothetical protein BJY59DRAFT_644291 [Rhodotorula toruloides]